jgi:deoxyadenosine/deoxycytidine kinase
MYIFTVDGNIGSGKSTLIKLMKKKYEAFANTRVVYLPEPVDIWESIKDKNGKNVIESYYENQVKFAFPFQMMAYISRVHQIKEIMEKYDDNTIIICERSVYTDKHVFAKMLHDYGTMNDIEIQIYKKWFDEFVKDFPFSGIIYVGAEPSKSLERVKIRNRKGEDIPLSYLNMCHRYHEDWLNNSNIPVLKLNGNKDFINAIPSTWQLAIETFIKTHSNIEIIDEYLHTMVTG